MAVHPALIILQILFFIMIGLQTFNGARWKLRVVRAGVKVSDGTFPWRAFWMRNKWKALLTYGILLGLPFAMGPVFLNDSELQALLPAAIGFWVFFLAYVTLGGIAAVYGSILLDKQPDHPLMARFQKPAQTNDSPLA